MDVKKIAKLTVKGVVIFGISDLLWLYATGRALGNALAWEQMTDQNVDNLINGLESSKHRVRGKMIAFAARRIANQKESGANV